MSLQWELGGISKKRNLVVNQLHTKSIKKDWFHTSSLVIIHWTIRFHLDLRVVLSHHSQDPWSRLACQSPWNDPQASTKQGNDQCNHHDLKRSKHGQHHVEVRNAAGCLFFGGSKKHMEEVCHRDLHFLHYLWDFGTNFCWEKTYFQFGQLQQLRLLVFPGNQNLHPAEKKVDFDFTHLQISINQTVFLIPLGCTNQPNHLHKETQPNCFTSCSQVT